MYKTISLLAAFSSAVLLAGAASAHGKGGSQHQAPPPPAPAPKPAVSVAAAAQVGGRSSLLNVAAAVKTPIADLGVAASAGRGGTELALDLGALGGGVGH